MHGQSEYQLYDVRSPERHCDVDLRDQGGAQPLGVLGAAGRWQGHTAAARWVRRMQSRGLEEEVRTAQGGFSYSYAQCCTARCPSRGSATQTCLIRSPVRLSPTYDAMRTHAYSSI